MAATGAGHHHSLRIEEKKSALNSPGFLGECRTSSDPRGAAARTEACPYLSTDLRSAANAATVHMLWQGSLKVCQDQKNKSNKKNC